MADITLLPSAKVPLVYEGENTMTTEWYRFFWNIYGFTGVGVIPVDKGGTGLDTIGNHQLIIGNTNNVFEPTTLVGSGITITYGAGTVTLAIGNSGVIPGTYGTASSVGQFTVDSKGTLVFAQDVPIAINANQITSGTIASARVSGSYTGITGVGILTAGTWNANTIDVAYGGTGQTTYTNGQLLIGNTTGNTLTKATLTAGANITITNAPGSITIASTASGGTVTSVAATVPSIFSITGSPITTSGTLAMTYSGTALPVANGGTGLTSTPTNGQLDIGNGSGFTRSTLTAGAGITVANASGAITISAIGGNSITSYTYTATTGQTVFTGLTYTPGNNGLSVFVNGSKQITSVNYVETNTTTVTFTTGLNVGDLVEMEVIAAIAGLSGVTGVTGTAPIVSTGGATPAISMPAATSSVDGYLTSADWTTFSTTVAVTDDTTTNSDNYVTFVAASSGNTPIKTSASKLKYHPSTGALTASIIYIAP